MVEHVGETISSCCALNLHKHLHANFIKIFKSLPSQLNLWHMNSQEHSSPFDLVGGVGDEETLRALLNVDGVTRVDDDRAECTRAAVRVLLAVPQLDCEQHQLQLCVADPTANTPSHTHAHCSQSVDSFHFLLILFTIC